MFFRQNAHVFGLAVLMFFGVAVASPDLADEAEEAVVEITAGQTHEIALSANPTTGYSWQVSIGGDAVTLNSSDYIPDKVPPGVVGSGGQQVMVFEGDEAGESVITLRYKRPWEDDSDDDEIVVINIRVVEPAP